MVQRTVPCHSPSFSSGCVSISMTNPYFQGFTAQSEQSPRLAEMTHTVPVLKALCTGARNTEKEIISGAFIYFELQLWPGNGFVFQNGMYKVKVLIASYTVPFEMVGGRAGGGNSK